jgi:hypothetical protein
MLEALVCTWNSKSQCGAIRMVAFPNDVLPSGFTLLCPIKLLCLAYKLSNGFHHMSKLLDVDTVEPLVAWVVAYLELS